jgi:hypothetical protein
MLGTIVAGLLFLTLILLVRRGKTNICRRCRSRIRRWFSHCGLRCEAELKKSLPLLMVELRQPLNSSSYLRPSRRLRCAFFNPLHHEQKSSCGSFLGIGELLALKSENLYSLECQCRLSKLRKSPTSFVQDPYSVEPNVVSFVMGIQLRFPHYLRTSAFRRVKEKVSGRKLSARNRFNRVQKGVV